MELISCVGNTRPGNPYGTTSASQKTLFASILRLFKRRPLQLRERHAWRLGQGKKKTGDCLRHPCSPPSTLKLNYGLSPQPRQKKKRPAQVGWCAVGVGVTGLRVRAGSVGLGPHVTGSRDGCLRFSLPEEKRNGGNLLYAEKEDPLVGGR